MTDEHQREALELARAVLAPTMVPAHALTGATGKDACPACGHAYDDHGQGGNCYYSHKITRRAPKPKGQ